MNQADVQEEELVTIMSETEGSATRQVVVTAGERLRREGAQELLLEQLRSLFEVPPAIDQRVRSASEAELLLWAKRLLKASSLDEVFAQA